MKIIALIRLNPDITIPMMAKQIGISVKAIEKQISLLKLDGIIERVGPDKGGNWKIKKQ